MRDKVIETGDIDDKRNFTDVRDMVKAYWLAAKNCEPGKLYLVGQEDEEMVWTFRDSIQRLLELSTLEPNEVQIKQVERFTRPTNVPFLISDVSEFRKTVDWERSYSMDDILSSTLNYWRGRVAEGKY